MSEEVSGTYEIATSLSGDLAEDYLRSCMADMYVTNAGAKARLYREMSETGEGSGADGKRIVQQYRVYERVIYSSLYTLIEGYGGFKLVKDPEHKNKNPLEPKAEEG